MATTTMRNATMMEVIAVWPAQVVCSLVMEMGAFVMRPASCIALILINFVL